ncbi:MAG: DUF3137 domain-containing protein [Ruminococcus sp.]|jgi:hypothetical protein|nr:DUF3137 domain-containing protein [Ruminococcus sp.]
MENGNFELLRETALANLKKAKRGGTIPYIVMAVCFVGGAVGVVKNIIPISFVSFFGFFVCAIWSGFGAARVAKTYKAYNSLVKRHLVTEALSESVMVLSYSADGCFPKEDFESSKLFPDFHNVRGNDLIEAVYKDRHFTMCDAELYRISRGKHGPRNVTVFLGRFMIIDSADYGNPDNRESLISDSILRFSESIGEKIKFKFSDGKVLIAWEYGGDIMETDHKGKTTTAEDRERIINGFKQVTDFLDSLPEKALY